MDDRGWLAEQFDGHRGHLRAVAYRMLGSLSEADDAVQDAWIKASRAEVGGIQNLGGWFTAIVSRVCLDMLRARASKREAPLEAFVPDPLVHAPGTPDVERDLVMAEAVGLALLVVLETLSPAERLAFVLHDLFGIPFEEIAPIVGRAVPATRQLASRARRRLQGAVVPDADLDRQRAVADAFVAASRDGDVEALLTLLDPDVVLRLDRGVMPLGASKVVRGAEAVAALGFRFSGDGWESRPVLVNGAAGLLVALRGTVFAVVGLTIAEGRIVEIDILADPERMRGLAPRLPVT